MTRVLLIQLPIPRLNYGRKTGNIPLAGAVLQQAVGHLPDVKVEFVPESAASYLGDAALLELIRRARPDVVGFTVYAWNLARSLWLAGQIKRSCGAKVVFGGPEITPDPTASDFPDVDFRVYGEGESVFRRLLENRSHWDRRTDREPADAIFTIGRSPYLSGQLEPEIENLVLLETQRGCPHRCGYCYYNKSRRSVCFADRKVVLEGVRWAVERGIGELYLLDPTLNIRPDLKVLLKAIARINRNRQTALISEIRAESVDAETAGLYAQAGFNGFEIGLQTTSARALRIMNRPTDLSRFLRGIHHLKENGIRAGVDLIAGLPGDDLAGFRQSVDFVVANDLADDIQVFPLAVLPGTEFRENSRRLGLVHAPDPPYTVVSTPGFSDEEMLQAFDYAESRFDTVLYPPPEVDVSRDRGAGTTAGQPADGRVRPAGIRCIRRLYAGGRRPLAEIEAAAVRLTHPYQIVVDTDSHDPDYVAAVLSITTAANPHTPVEMIFFEPRRLPDTRRLLAAAKLVRPHFLDGDLRYLYPEPGNRAVLFTVVSHVRERRFSGSMRRQVYWWRHPELPLHGEMASLFHLDGILVDSPVPAAVLAAWQERMAPYAEDLPHLSFADPVNHRRWIALTLSEEYWPGSLEPTVEASAT